jgi:hypothetical protein
LFDRVIVVDWSAANLPTSASNRANAVWIGCHDAEGAAEWHHRTRAGAEAQLVTLIDTARAAGMRLLVGFDFAMGYPAGFRRPADRRGAGRGGLALAGGGDHRRRGNRNNRFDVASRINAAFPEGPGPFWSHPSGQSWPGLPFRRDGIDYAVLGLAEPGGRGWPCPARKAPGCCSTPARSARKACLACR